MQGVVTLSALFARRTYATPGGLRRFFASLTMTRFELRKLDGTAEAVPFPSRPITAAVEAES